MSDWQTQSTRTRVDIDIMDEFDEEQLLQCLIDSGWLSIVEAVRIRDRARERRKFPTPPVLVDEDTARDNLDRARLALRRRDKASALIYVEYALGREWIGDLQ